MISIIFAPLRLPAGKPLLLSAPYIDMMTNSLRLPLLFARHLKINNFTFND
jgi:hypothetical protein